MWKIGTLCTMGWQIKNVKLQEKNRRIVPKNPQFYLSFKKEKNRVGEMDQQ